MAMVSYDTRIIPKEVVKAYKKTGFKVGQGLYYGKYNQIGCACGMGVFYVIQQGLSKEEILENRTINEKKDVIAKDFYNECNQFFNKTFGYAYKEGFGRGFDGLSKVPLMSEREKLGYEDGLKARELCISEGLFETKTL